MQNALTTIDHVIQWIKDHNSYIWTLYSADKKTILSRNESTVDETKSTEWIKRELTNRSLYGGTFALYINDKKGNGGEWTDVVIAPQMGANGQQVAGIGSQNGYYGVGSVEQYIEKEFERRELQRRVQELEAGIGQSEKFWERQIDKVTEHPNFNPNTAVLAIGGLASRVVNILEIAMGVNGSKVEPLVTQAQQEKPSTPVNGVKEEVMPHETNGENTEGEEITYDGDALAEVCDDLHDIYPDKKPEEVLLLLKNMIKKDPAIASTVRSMAKF